MHLCGGWGGSSVLLLTHKVQSNWLQCGHEKERGRELLSRGAVLPILPLSSCLQAQNPSLPERASLRAGQQAESTGFSPVGVGRGRPGSTSAPAPRCWDNPVADPVRLPCPLPPSPGSLACWLLAGKRALEVLRDARPGLAPLPSQWPGTQMAPLERAPGQLGGWWEVLCWSGIIRETLCSSGVAEATGAWGSPEQRHHQAGAGGCGWRTWIQPYLKP